VAQLVELIHLRDRMPALARASLVLQPPDVVEVTDWSDLAAKARQLAEYLHRLDRPPSAKTVTALTDPAARQRLGEAIQVAEAAINGGIDESWTHVTKALFDVSADVSTGIVLAAAKFPDLSKWAAARSNDAERSAEWVRYMQVRREATDLGIEFVVDEVCRGQIRLEVAADAFRKRFLGLWLDTLYAREPALARFSFADHDKLVSQFIALDRKAVQTAPARLRSMLLTAPGRPRADGSAPGSSELGTLLREANKKRRHMPLRRLFAALPTILPRLKPCLMMSPLAVSTYLNAPDMTFDVVVFDEASQVRPHDAISAIFRGRQLVVAGDPKQLPPTDFFNRSSDGDLSEDEPDGGTADFESLLDVCLSLGITRRRLKWHYRSRREGLIAFSNKYFYEGDLVTFPSVDDVAGRAVRFERIADGRFENGVNTVEARRVADLVMSHFRTTPDLSLGVIAFSLAQQNRILDELEMLRKADPTLEAYFKEDRPERFFVKNLENVQGDERDVVFLSVGYGPDVTGRVMMRFGPLNRQGGQRRLNVAITRARLSMTVASSMSARDLDLSRTQADGPRLLRAFLDYAERGPVALTEAITEASAAGFDSPFEREVFEELERRGLKLHRQVGCGGFKIDMAVVDPDASGRYVLGIECDGATYHSSATARDRDRLRQQVLEGLGWRICRIWSTDWVRNLENQVQRVLTMLAKPSGRPSPPVSEVASPVRTTPARIDEPSFAPPNYSSINEVPVSVIRNVLLSVLREFGTTGAEDLFIAVCRRLGFKRLGAKIRTRINVIASRMVADGSIIRQEGDRISIGKT
jgi:very-short-patch-repair endonuclease